MSQSTFKAGVSNSVSYAGHILTKKGLAGHIKRKNVSAGRNRCLYTTKNNNLSIIWVILMMSRTAQTHLAGRVFETPALKKTILFFLPFRWSPFSSSLSSSVSAKKRKRKRYWNRFFTNTHTYNFWPVINQSEVSVSKITNFVTQVLTLYDSEITRIGYLQNKVWWHSQLFSFASSDTCVTMCFDRKAFDWGGFK